MKSIFRTASLLTTTLSHRSLNPNPKILRTATVSLPLTTVIRRITHRNIFMAGGDSSPTSVVVEKQFDEFRQRLEESGNLRDRIKAVAMEIESVTRIMHSSLLLVHQSRPVPGIIITIYIMYMCQVLVLIETCD